MAKLGITVCRSSMCERLPGNMGERGVLVEQKKLDCTPLHV